MRDYADMALKNTEENYEHYEKYKNAPSNIQYEEGIIDARGNIIGNPNSVPTKKSSLSNIIFKKNP